MSYQLINRKVGKTTTDEFLSNLFVHVKDCRYEIVPTKKYISTRRSLGLTTLDVEEILLSLREIHVFKADEDDRDRPGEKLWIFKYSYQKNLFYIKIKLFVEKATCISFHLDNIEID